MSQPQLRTINIGTHANDGTGDTLRVAAGKINDNFNDVYAALGIGGDVTFVNSVIAGDGIEVNRETGNVTITSVTPKFDTIAVAGNTSLVADLTHNVLTVAAGTNVGLVTDHTTNTLTVNAVDPRVANPTDWNASSGPTRILNKPAIPAAQVSSDWNAVTGVAQILNKPSILQSDWTQEDDTQIDYIKHKPSIMQADWLDGDTSSPGFIKNKPSVPVDVTDLTDIDNLLIKKAHNYIHEGSVNAGDTTTIYTFAYADVVGGTAIIHALIDDGAGGLDIQSAQVSIIISQPASGDPVVAKIFYNPLHTGLSPFAVFDASWDNVAGRAIITMQNTGTATAQVKVTAIEYN
jgi:hypothetical protein